MFESQIMHFKAESLKLKPKCTDLGRKSLKEFLDESFVPFASEMKLKQLKLCTDV